MDITDSKSSEAGSANFSITIPLQLDEDGLLVLSIPLPEQSGTSTPTTSSALAVSAAPPAEALSSSALVRPGALEPVLLRRHDFWNDSSRVVERAIRRLDVFSNQLLNTLQGMALTIHDAALLYLDLCQIVHPDFVTLMPALLFQAFCSAFRGTNFFDERNPQDQSSIEIYKDLARQHHLPPWLSSRSRCLQRDYHFFARILILF